MHGLRYRNGFFKHADGLHFGQDTLGNKFPIRSPNPKLFLPVGNCLMGHLDRRDCMATSWMNSAGVCQMLGYIQPTWYGYLGWGVLDYFTALAAHAAGQKPVAADRAWTEAGS